LLICLLLRGYVITVVYALTTSNYPIEHKLRTEYQIQGISLFTVCYRIDDLKDLPPFILTPPHVYLKTFPFSLIESVRIWFNAYCYSVTNCMLNTIEKHPHNFSVIIEDGVYTSSSYL